MHFLTGSVMFHAWGSTHVLPDLLGVEADGRPWAEVWFGTHPGGPSTLREGGAPLSDLVGPLGFLAKFLAAAAPLSLQVHPTEEQAERGYRREETDGIPRSSPVRTYRDPFAKPEIMIARSPFRGLCGFRPVAEAVSELRGCGGAALAALVEEHGFGETVRRVLTERPAIRPDHPRFVALDAAYPDDPGALVALLLNEITLRPGEAVFLPAGQLHMYLDGFGVEVMGASDNVVRGGLTTKHVDVTELSRVLDPEPARPAILRPDAEGWYRVPTSVFAVQELRRPTSWTAADHELVLWLAADGVDPEATPGSASVVPAGESATFGGGLAYRISRSRAS